MAEKARMGEIHMEAAVSTVEVTPRSAAAENPIPRLVAGRRCRPLAGAVGGWIRDERRTVPTQGQEDFLVRCLAISPLTISRPAISGEVVRCSGVETLDRRLTRAVAEFVIGQARSPQHETLRAARGRGSHLETRPFDRRLDWHTLREWRWEAAGVPLG